MSRGKELARNSIYMIVGKICTQLVSFLLLPLYTGMLTPTEYGTVDLINTYQQLLVYVVALQMENSVFRFLVERRGQQEKWGEVISTSMVIVGVCSVIFTLVFAALQGLAQTPQIIFLWTNVLAVSFSGLFLQIARGFGRNKDYVMGSFLSAVSTVVMNIVFVALLRWGASGMLMAVCLGNVVCIGYLTVRCRVDRYISLRSVRRMLGKEMLKYALPMIPNALAWWVIGASDRTVVLMFLGATQSGVLAVAHKFSSVYFTLFHMFNLSWMESAVLHIKDKDRNEFFSSIINRSLWLFWSVGIGIIAVMPFVFPLFVHEQYAAAYEQIPLLILGVMLNILQGLYSNAYLAVKETGRLAKSTVMAAVINVAAGVMLIRWIGLYAAPVSTILAYGVISWYRCRDTRRYVQVTIDRKRMAILAGMLLITMAAYYSGIKAAQCMALLATATAAIWLNRSILIDIMHGAGNMLRKLMHRN